jgi:hypothetical protein
VICNLSDYYDFQKEKRVNINGLSSLENLVKCGSTLEELIPET